MENVSMNIEQRIGKLFGYKRYEENSTLPSPPVDTPVLTNKPKQAVSKTKTKCYYYDREGNRLYVTQAGYDVMYKAHKANYKDTGIAIDAGNAIQALMAQLRAIDVDSATIQHMIDFPPTVIIIEVLTGEKRLAVEQKLLT